jgi:hypothetical protein
MSPGRSSCRWTYHWRRRPGGVASRRGRAQRLAPGVVVPNAAIAVPRGRAHAPTLRVIEPSLRFGAGIDREADDDREQNSKQQEGAFHHFSASLTSRLRAISTAVLTAFSRLSV